MSLELHDKHSLYADYNELKRQEAALKKRLAKLSLKSTLRTHGKTKVQSLMDNEFNGWNEGLTDGDYGWGSKSWSFNPDSLQGGWLAGGNKTRHVDENNDPFGTEWHYFAHDGKAKWKGRECTGDGCPQSSDGLRNLERYASHLAAATAFGVSAAFSNLSANSTGFAQAGWDEPAGSGTFARGQHDDFIPGLGEPDVEFQPNASALPSDFDVGLLTSRRPPLWDLDRPDVSYRLCLRNASAAECEAQLRAWRAGWEWRPQPCPPADDGFPRPEGCGDELVGAALERESGYDAARGLATPDDIEDGLLDPVLSNDTADAFLGPDLYSEYVREGSGAGEAAAWDGSAGRAHRALAAGVRGAGERRRFRDAYGASAWEWCLAHHRRDADFPRACARGLWADPRLPTAKPYQGRHKALTAPEEVLEGVEEAFGDLLGADRSEDVRPAPTPLLPHPNRFEYGAQAVPDGSVQGAGPAPWERIKVCSAGDTQPAVWCGVRAGWACSWASRG